jgi:hypothetical protein
MGFRFFYTEEEDKELKADQEEAIDSLEDINSEDDEEIAKMDLDDEDIEEVEDLIDEEYKIEEGVTSKKPLEILKGRYKHNARLLILKKMNGGKDDFTPRTLALFKLMFEYMPKMGRYGKWMIRKDKKSYMEKHPMVDEVRNIKRKRKKLKLLKRRGDIKTKQKRGKKIASKKTAGRTVDASGKTKSK